MSSAQTRLLRFGGCGWKTMGKRFWTSRTKSTCAHEQSARPNDRGWKPSVQPQEPGSGKRRHGKRRLNVRNVKKWPMPRRSSGSRRLKRRKRLQQPGSSQLRRGQRRLLRKRPQRLRNAQRRPRRRRRKSRRLRAGRQRKLRRSRADRWLKSSPEPSRCTVTHYLPPHHIPLPPYGASDHDRSLRGPLTILRWHPASHLCPTFNRCCCPRLATICRRRRPLSHLCPALNFNCCCHPHLARVCCRRRLALYHRPGPLSHLYPALALVYHRRPPSHLRPAFNGAFDHDRSLHGPLTILQCPPASHLCPAFDYCRCPRLALTCRCRHRHGHRPLSHPCPTLNLGR